MLYKFNFFFLSKIDKYDIKNVFLADVHESAKSLYNVNLRESLALVIGSESVGVSAEVIYIYILYIYFIYVYITYMQYLQHIILHTH